MTCYTGKSGYINFQIELERIVKRDYSIEK